MMVKGILMICLEPASMAFIANEGQDSNVTLQRYCTPEEIRELLLDLSALPPWQRWPICELQVRLPGSFSSATLIKHGLGSRFQFESKEHTESTMNELAIELVSNALTNRS
jgi:hypothetical protein